jgi:dihydrofolate reductase
MTKVLLDMAVSLDGCVASVSGEDVGLYDWYFDPPAASAAVVRELVETTGAIVIGRGAFGTGEDAGWDDTPYRVRHVVVTHRPPPADARWAVDFVFATEGPRQALEVAAAAAGDRWVTVGGGADIARQFLAAGLVDEVQLHVVPLIVGDGVRLFDASVGARRLRPLRVVDSTGVTHLRYAVDRE